jgi:hypothetical protein
LILFSVSAEWPASMDCLDADVHHLSVGDTADDPVRVRWSCQGTIDAAQS